METEKLKKFRDEKFVHLTGYQGYIIDRLVDVVYELELRIKELENQVDDLRSKNIVYGG